MVPSIGSEESIPADIIRWRKLTFNNFYDSMELVRKDQVS